MKTKSKKTKVNSQTKLNRRIAAEAKSLGLSRSEYLRLTLALSKSLRESLQKDTNIDPVALLRFVESPLFSILMQSVVQTAISSFKATDGESEKDTTNETPPATNDTPAPNQVAPAPANPQQHPHQHPYGMQRPPQGFQPYPQMPQQYVPMRPVQQQPGLSHTERVSPAPRQAQPIGRYSFWP